MDNYIYTINAFSDEPIMLINTHIGNDEELGVGVIGDLFLRELLDLDNQNKKRIQVWINSPGGSVQDGYDIYTGLLKTKTKIDTYCTGMAASISGVIFQAGRKRFMMDFSNLMYHNPYGGSDQKTMEVLSDSIATMVATRTGKTLKDVRRIMDRTTFMNAEDALANGFCDEIEASGEMNKKRTITTENAVASWREFVLITNSILNINNNNSMDAVEFKKITNKLDLNPDASLDSTLLAIDALIAAKNKAEKACKDEKEELDKLKSELDGKAKDLKKNQEDFDAMKAEYDKLKAKIAKDEEDSKAKNEEDKKNKAKNLVKDFVVRSILSNDVKVIEVWENRAILDFDGTKNLLETLPVNRKAVVINLGNDQNHNLGSVIAAEMAKNLAKSMDNK